MIRLSDVGMRYPTSQGMVTVFEKVNLTIEPGQKWGILGRNGAGRTTTAGGDTGDLDGVPAHVIQVASWANTAAAARLKPDEAALQAEHAAVPFAATLVRFRGGTWRVVVTPEQWAAYVRLILREGLL